MSHFTVMVAGDDYEDQMAPFCEDLDVVPEDSKWFNVEVKKGDGLNWIKRSLESLKERFKEADKNPSLLEYYTKQVAALEKVIKDYENDPDGIVEYIKETENYEEDEDGNLGYFTNDSFWDWYSVGGRWQGYFKLKEGADGSLGTSSAWLLKGKEKEEYEAKLKGKADQCRKGDIDLAGMFKDQVHKLKERYQKAQELLKKYPNFIEFKNYKPEAEIELRRSEYNALTQEGAKEISEFLGWSGTMDEFKVSQSEYIKKHKDECILPYGFLNNDGEYISNGDMGWWGCDSKNEHTDTFSEKFWAWWKTIDDDTTITVLDCHV